MIVLDEADSLTTDAQTALRRIIEVSSKGTRFCIICNYVSRIIDPLTSRCAKFRFKPVSEEDGLVKLEQICQAEAVRFAGDRGTCLKRLMTVTGGDLRRAVGLLQCAHQLARPLAEKDFEELAGVIPAELIQEAVGILTDASLDTLKVFDWVNKKLVREGYPAHQFIAQLTEAVARLDEVGEMRKAMASLKLAQIDMALTEGADEQLQLLSAMASLHETFLPSTTVKALF